MRTFAQIIADFSPLPTSPPRSTNRSKLREMFTRLLFDATPVVADNSARTVLYPTTTGDEKVLNKATDAVERYDATAAKWVTVRRLSDKLGTEDFNPRVQSFLGYPKIAASPPTITDWGVDDSIGGIASSIYYSPIANGVVDLNAPWRYSCAAIQKIGGAHVNANSVRGLDGTGGFYAIEFMYDARKWEFLMTAHFTGSGWRILVNNEFAGGPTGAGETMQFGTANSVTHRIAIDFGSNAIRHIRLELSSDITFKGIAIEPTATAWQPAHLPIGPMVMCVGDSFIAGSAATLPPMNFLNILGKLMGWRNTWSDGEGGTGYLTAGSGATYATRVPIDVIPRKPDIVIVEGGRNDLNTFTASAIAAAAGSLFTTLRSSLPAAKLICVAPFKLTDNPDQAAIDTRDAVRTAVAGTADLFIDPIVATVAGSNSLGWITPANLSTYRYSDAVHPTEAGSKYMAFRLASALSLAMPF